MRSFVERWLPHRRAMIIATHMGLAVLGFLVAFLLVDEFQISPDHWVLFRQTAPLLFVVRMAAFHWCHLYEGLWRYVGIRDMLLILRAVTLGSVIVFASVLAAFGGRFPATVLVIDWLVCSALVAGIRLAARMLRELDKERNGRQVGKRILVVGAGDAGEMLVRDVHRSRMLNCEVMGFVDDDPLKQKRRIHDVEVLGKSDELPGLCHVHLVNEVVIAVPTATGEELRRIIQACRSAKVQIPASAGMTNEAWVI